MSQHEEKLDERVKSAITTIGTTMIKDVDTRGWSPPMLAALSDDAKTIKAVMIEVIGGSVTRSEWFAEARRTLQRHINEGATTVLAGLCSDLSGFMDGVAESRKGVIVLGVDRYCRFGSVFLASGERETRSMGLDKFKKDIVGEAFELLFEDINWPVVH